MDSTFFTVPSARRGDFRRCYDVDGSYKRPVTVLRDMSEGADYFKTYTEEGFGYYGGSEGLVSSVSDFYNFAAMLLNSGVCESTGKRVLSEASAALMTSNQLPGGGDLSKTRANQMGFGRFGFGLGVFVALSPSSNRGEPYN